VGDAIATVHPWGVDACSALESAPGKKDPRKVRAFIANARAAAAAEAYEPDGDGPRPYDWMEQGT
jgi:phosphoribosylanthranilate isomerase